MVTRIDFNTLTFGEPLYLWLLVVPGVLLVLWTGRSHAAPPPEPANDLTPTARELSDQGLRQYQNNDYDPAIESFLEAFALSNNAGLLFNGKGRVLNLDAPALTLPASMGGNRTPVIDQLQLETGCRCWIEEYHAHLWAGGDPWVEAPDRLRRLTVQEAAALQTFPAGWQFVGTQSAQFRQIGNAVPPELAFQVARAVSRMLGHAEVDLQEAEQAAA